jgi:membrane protein implicated in regulation of membrane protease activity
MDEHVFAIIYWPWIGLAAVFFIIEVSTGTGFLLWTGIASILVGMLLFVVPSLTLTTQLLCFTLFSILVAIFFKIYLKHHPLHTADPTLNRRAEQYIGRVFTLAFPIENGMGKIHADDSMWRVICQEDLPAGAQVRVISADGVILKVESFNPPGKNS